MPLRAPNLDQDSTKSIEQFVRARAEWPVGLQDFATADLPDAARSPFSLLWDSTTSRLLGSDGANWLTFGSTASANTWTGVQTFSSNPVLTGGGISFPATQVPSADANTLDDYEEGSWTPDLQFGGAKVGITYASRSGVYTKFGRIVVAHCFIALSSKGSSTGVAIIEGLPFAAGLEVGAFQITSANVSSLTDTYGTIRNSETGVRIQDNGGGTRTNLTDTNFANNSDFRITVIYTV